MIDRSYLPFQSAREHQDRGMLKWMGFFLSEHTSSLKEEKLKELKEYRERIIESYEKLLKERNEKIAKRQERIKTIS